jgi:hypothetical protein
MEPGQNSTLGDIAADINYFPATGKVIGTDSWKSRYLGIGDEYTKRMTIHNVRALKQKFNLDHNGFQFVTLPERQRNTDNETVIQEQYYAELEELLKKMYTDPDGFTLRS